MKAGDGGEMFGILKSIRNGAEASRLRKRGQTDSRPDSYVELCRHFVAQGKLRAALEAASEGLIRFPHSTRLREMHRFTWRELKATEIAEIRQRIEAEGATDDFLALIELHLDCEDFDTALEVTEEWRHTRDDDGQSRLVEAEILLERFYRDRVAADARRAIALLSRVLEMDGDILEAHLALAKAFHFIGAVSKSLLHTYRALDLDSENELANELYSELATRPLENDDVTLLLNAVEEEADRGGAPTIDLDVEKRRQIMSGLVRLSQLNGVVRAAFVDESLAMVAEGGEGRSFDDLAESELCKMASGFRDASGVSCRRMGIGAFRSCVIDSGERAFHFHSVGRTVVLIESGERRHRDLVAAEGASFVAACLRSEEEPAHA